MREWSIVETNNKIYFDNQVPTHVNPMHANAPESISAHIDGYELAVGKYAWKWGECQCVIFLRI